MAQMLIENTVTQTPMVGILGAPVADQDPLGSAIFSALMLAPQASDGSAAVNALPVPLSINADPALASSLSTNALTATTLSDQDPSSVSLDGLLTTDHHLIPDDHAETLIAGWQALPSLLSAEFVGFQSIMPSKLPATAAETLTEFQRLQGVEDVREGDVATQPIQLQPLLNSMPMIVTDQILVLQHTAADASAFSPDAAQGATDKLLTQSFVNLNAKVPTSDLLNSHLTLPEQIDSASMQTLNKASVSSTDNSLVDLLARQTNNNISLSKPDTASIQLPLIASKLNQNQAEDALKVMQQAIPSVTPAQQMTSIAPELQQASLASQQVMSAQTAVTSSLGLDESLEAVNSVKAPMVSLQDVSLKSSMTMSKEAQVAVQAPNISAAQPKGDVDATPEQRVALQQLLTLSDRIQSIDVRRGVVDTNVVAQAPSLTSPLPSLPLADQVSAMSYSDKIVAQQSHTNTQHIAATVSEQQENIESEILNLESEQGLVFASTKASAEGTLGAAQPSLVGASTTAFASPSFDGLTSGLLQKQGNMSQQQGQQQDRQSTAAAEAMIAKSSDETHEGSSTETHFSTTLSGLQTAMPLVSGKMDWLVSPVSLRQPQWTQDMGQKIGQMANAKMDEISVRIDPEDLGPVQIKLHMTEDKTAHITMTALHGLTRDMLENALPRLRELLAQQGIDLGSATVDTGAKEQGDQDQSSQQRTASASDSHDAAVNPTTEVSNATRALEGVIDHYA